MSIRGGEDGGVICPSCGEDGDDVAVNENGGVCFACGYIGESEEFLEDD